MDRAADIRSAITTAMAAISPFRDHQPGVRVAIGRDTGHRIAKSVFDALERGGYLAATNWQPPDREIRITLAITEAIGNCGRMPGDYRPGQWYEVPAPDVEAATDAVYRNLVHSGCVAEETS